MELTNPSITRLARRAGIKSISSDCFDVIRYLIKDKLEEVIKNSLIINNERKTKTLMCEDIYESIILSGENITRTNYLATNTINK